MSRGRQRPTEGMFSVAVPHVLKLRRARDISMWSSVNTLLGAIGRETTQLHAPIVNNTILVGRGSRDAEGGLN
jgi:hypothetical protein